MVAALLFAVTIHEVAHGYTAYRWGDDTAMRMGRLTLNPLKHLDFVGSLLLPAILIFAHAPFVLGYAKPVPVNVFNLRDYKKGNLYVSSAGIIANLSCALLAGWLLRILLGLGILSTPAGVRPFFADLVLLLGYSVIINSVLAVFNLIPFPPLDGSRILMTFFPMHLKRHFVFFERFGLVLIIFLVITNVLARLIAFCVPPTINISLGSSGLHAFLLLLGEVK